MKSKRPEGPDRGRKFYETKAFREEQAKWYKKAFESGFTDLESLGEHGPLRNDAEDAFHVFTPEDPEALDVCLREYIPIREAVFAIEEQAKAALYNSKIWIGLPKQARRWWAYVVLGGLSENAAMEHVGVKQGNHQRVEGWKVIIMSRIDETNGR